MNQKNLNLKKVEVQRGGSYLCDMKVCHGFCVSARSGSSKDTSLINEGFRSVKDIE